MVNKNNRMPESGILRGAGPLALYLFGDAKKRRAIYGMSEKRKRALGLYYEGKFLCGRKATIDRKISEREEGVVEEIAVLAEPERVEIAAKAAKKGGR